MKKLTLTILSLCAVVGLMLVSTAANASSGEQLMAGVDEATPSSVPAHEVELATAGARVTMLDGVVRFDGGLGQADASDLSAAADGLCRSGTDMSERVTGSARSTVAIDAAKTALSSFDCSVSAFALDITPDGAVTGIVATTDAESVAPLQKRLGAGVTVQFDLAGVSPGPSA